MAGGHLLTTWSPQAARVNTPQHIPSRFSGAADLVAGSLAPSVASRPDRPRKSRITIITNGNFFSRLALDRLLRRTVDLYEYQIIVTTGLRRQRGNRAREALDLLRRWGYAYSLYKLATYLLPATLGLLTSRPAFLPSLCRRYGLSVHRARNVNAAREADRIRGFAPDLLVSFSCPYRIGPSLLAVPAIGSLNAHSSLLPKYAGVCTYVHVLACGEKVTGITIHEMVDQFDAGRIVEQESVPIPPRTSLFTLFAQQCLQGGDLLARALSRCLAAGAIVGQAQDPDARTYFGEPTRNDIIALKKNGHSLFRAGDAIQLWRLLAWTRPAS